MKPWTAWLARLGLAGSCLAWAGCGGSDVPDPDSDSNAATSPAPAASGGPPAAVADAEPAAPPAGEPPAVVAAVAPGRGAAAAKGAAEAPGEPATEDGEAKAASKSDASSPAAEMLALANAPAPTPGGDKPAEGGAEAAPGGGGPAPGGMPGMASMRPGAGGASGYPGAPGAAGGSAGMPGMPGMAGGGGAPQGYPGAPGGAMAGVRGGMPGMAGGAPGMAGMPGAIGGGAGGVADFQTPTGAVTAFLDALRAKDPDRLHEATALRAGLDGESSPTFQKMFLAVHERSLSSEELDELAKKFENMNIVGSNQAKSSGRLGVIVGATVDGAQVTRTITVRKEKAGWKVVDVSSTHRFEKPFNVRGGVRRGGGGR